MFVPNSRSICNLAKHILRLRRLNPLNATPDARMRGTVVHEILENYFREWPNIPAEWRQAKFIEYWKTLFKTRFYGQPEYFGVID